jgi:23S rRNA (uracil1939-C5)-methyltransferase
MFLRIVELARLDQATVLVDVACGIGLASLNLAKYVKRTIGIDEDEHMIHGSLKNAETNTISNAYFVNGSCDEILLDLAQHVSASERMVCYFDVTTPTPPSKTFTTVASCPKVGVLVYIGESPQSFVYDCETKLCTGNGFRLCTVELFDCGPLSAATKIVAIFERDVPNPND